MDFAEHLRKSDVSENSKVIRLLAENTNFHVHFWLLLSKRALQGLFEKKCTSTKNLGGLTTPLPPPAPEGLFNSASCSLFYER